MSEENQIISSIANLDCSSAGIPITAPSFPPQEISLHIENHWLMKLNTKGIHFNREFFTKFKADDFAREVMNIFEENFEVRFEKRIKEPLTLGKTTMEEFKPPENMNLFFKRLHALKNSVKAASESHPEESVQLFALSIYQELHELYKTEEEHENSDCTSSCSDA